VSQRESKVLAAGAERLTNAEIGQRLQISVRTVESHVSSLLQKLDLADRLEPARHGPELAGGRAGGTEAGREPADLDAVAMPCDIPPWCCRPNRRRSRHRSSGTVGGNTSGCAGYAAALAAGLAVIAGHDDAAGRIAAAPAPTDGNAWGHACLLRAEAGPHGDPSPTPDQPVWRQIDAGLARCDICRGCSDVNMMAQWRHESDVLRRHAAP
jgi:DNA-binding CsgD family transcriptional regulator